MVKRIIGQYFREIKLRLRKESYTGKVFCIGYNKTGTTSVGKAFELLGYRNSSFNKKVWRKYYAKNEMEKLLRYTAKFDSFDDLPWLKEDMIPLLDKTFPNSKFVYLTREEDSWKKSFKNWSFKTFGKRPDLDRAWEGYKKHEKFVYDYFKGRSPEEFIVLDVKGEKSFRKLSQFLGKETNMERFPHFNKS